MLSVQDILAGRRFDLAGSNQAQARCSPHTRLEIQGRIVVEMEKDQSESAICGDRCERCAYQLCIETAISNIHAGKLKTFDSWQDANAGS